MGLRSRWGRRASALYPDVDAAVRAGIIPLASLHSGTGLDDLAVWGRTLDGVRVVGLGEATHGTREFFTLKHRPKRSIEDTLDRLATGDFILDLRDTAGSPALHAWATAKQQMRAYGSVTLPGPLTKNQTAQVIPARDFDGIAFVRYTSRARPLTGRALRTGKTGFGHALGWPTSARSHPRGNRVGWTVRR